MSGKGYTSDTWQAWVKSENATPVPGAKSFIEALLQTRRQSSLSYQPR
ncbi:hypothetical protein ACOBV8_18455 (plasmid) [Pseudoalteromonas espejiana]